MKRRTVIQVALGLGIASAAGAWPARGAVDPAVVDNFAQLRSSLVTADSLLGPGLLKRSAAEQVENIAGLYERIEPRGRARLFEIGALFAEFCGWLADDLGDLPTGAAWSNRALEWALASGSADIAAYVLMRMSQQAQLIQERARITTLAEAAIRYEPQVDSPSVKAAIYQQAAHASALDGQEHDALARLDHAQELAASPAQQPDPHALGSYCTTHYVAVQRAAVYSTLGDHRRALDEYDAIMREWPNSFHRERGVHLARRTVVAARAGQLDAAVASGTEALEIARNTQSERTRRELATSVSIMKPWQTQSSVRDFIEAVTTMGSEQSC